MTQTVTVTSAADALFDEIPEDGRRARRHRSRDLAVDALLDLLDDGVVQPTAQQVAERSGVSLRSIFRIFDDVESLHAAAATRQLARVRHLFVDVSTEGTLKDRIHEIVTISCRLYESVAPIRRAAVRTAPVSAPLREHLARVRGWLRAEIDRAFEPELTGDVSGSAAALAELLLSFEAWDQLRTAQGLDADNAADVVRSGLLAVIEAASGATIGSNRVGNESAGR